MGATPSRLTVHGAPDELLALPKAAQLGNVAQSETVNAAANALMSSEQSSLRCRLQLTVPAPPRCSP